MNGEPLRPCPGPAPSHPTEKRPPPRKSTGWTPSCRAQTEQAFGGLRAASREGARSPSPILQVRQVPPKRLVRPPPRLTSPDLPSCAHRHNQLNGPTPSGGNTRPSTSTTLRPHIDTMGHRLSSPYSLKARFLRQSQETPGADHSRSSTRARSRRSHRSTARGMHCYW